MAIITDEAGASLLDQAGAPILDEAGAGPASAAAYPADQMTSSGGDVYDWVWRQGWIRRAGI